jgi:hypothetical protein
MIPTFFIQTAKYDDQTRTFCTNRGGYVAMENYSRFRLCQRARVSRQKIPEHQFRFSVEGGFDGAGDGQSGLWRIHRPVGHPDRRRQADPAAVWRSEARPAFHVASHQQRVYCTPTLTNVVCGDIAMALPERILTNLIEGLEKLNQVVPGVSNDETLLYAPEIKFFATQVETDRDLETAVRGNVRCRRRPRGGGQYRIGQCHRTDPGQGHHSPVGQSLMRS